MLSTTIRLPSLCSVVCHAAVDRGDSNSTIELVVLSQRPGDSNVAVKVSPSPLRTACTFWFFRVPSA